MGCCTSIDTSRPAQPAAPGNQACSLCHSHIPLGEARRHVCGHRFHRTCLLALALGEAICPDCGTPVQLSTRSRRAQAKAALLKPLDPSLQPRPVEFADVSVERYEGCVVCQEDLNDNTLVRLPCNHVLHSDCADGWLQHKRECPLCRSPAHPSRLPPADQNLIDRLAELADQNRQAGGPNNNSMTPQLTPQITPSVSPARSPNTTPRASITSGHRDAPPLAVAARG